MKHGEPHAKRTGDSVHLVALKPGFLWWFGTSRKGKSWDTDLKVLVVST